MTRVTGSMAAAVASGLSWLLTHTIYGVLRIIYRRDMRFVALFAGIIFGVLALLGWIF